MLKKRSFHTLRLKEYDSLSLVYCVNCRYYGRRQGKEIIMNELKTQVERGEISLRSAAYRLYRWGRVSFVPSDREVIRLLHIIV